MVISSYAATRQSSSLSLSLSRDGVVVALLLLFFLLAGGGVG